MHRGCSCVSISRLHPLPEPVKARLLACADSRISRDGVLVIRRKAIAAGAEPPDALHRLQQRLDSVAQAPQGAQADPAYLASVQRMAGRQEEPVGDQAGRGKVAG